MNNHSVNATDYVIGNHISNDTNATNTNLTGDINLDLVSCSKQSETYSYEVPTIYTIVVLTLIFLCSILYYIKLIKNRSVYVQHGSIISYIKTYVIIGWKFKSMYGSLFTQLFDQVSDVSVILQLYYLSNDENDHVTTCYHMNTYYLFISSLFIFLFYRFLSSFLIYRLLSDSNSPFLYKIFLTILQFFDLSFIITLKINYKFQNITPCNPQRYITNLEAIFEAAPQFIVQLYFILTLNMKENSFDYTNTNLVVIISLVFSLMSIVSKKLAQDKECVNRKWQSLNFSWKKRAEKQMANFQSANFEEESKENVYYHNTRCICCSFNIKYFVHRIIWRLFIILHRLILWVLLWRIIGGFWLIWCMLVEFIFYAVVYYFTQKNVFFESIMGYVLQQVEFDEKYKHLEVANVNDLNRYIVVSTLMYALFLSIWSAFTIAGLNIFGIQINVSWSAFTLMSIVFVFTPMVLLTMRGFVSCVCVHKDDSFGMRTWMLRLSTCCFCVISDMFYLLCVYVFDIC